MTVSELINEEYKTWTPGIYLINAPTGKGKTQFILNQLYEFAHFSNKKIAMFVNRTILKQQLNENLKSKDIYISTYQKLEFNNYLTHNIHFAISNNKYMVDLKKKINEFDYLILDEAHYIFQDSSFISYTDTIMNCIDEFKGIIILMSATAELIKEFYQNRIIKEYYIEPDYSYIKRIVVFSNDNEFIDIINQIPENEKIIYFGGSKNKMKKFKSEIPNSDFVDSSNKDRNNSVHQIIQKNNFDCRILFSTSVLDNGVSIIDKSLKHIFIDLADITTIIQCIGRKRIIENEKISIYIRNNRKNFHFKWRDLEKNMEILNDYNHMPKDKFLDKYERKHLPNFFDNKINIIKPIEFGFRNRFNFIESIIKDKKLFINEIKRIFPGCKITKYRIDAIEEFLSQNLMKKFYGNEKEKIIQKINICQNGRLVKGIKTINAFLEENKIPFKIESKRELSRKSSYFKKTFWQICSKN